MHVILLVRDWSITERTNSSFITSLDQCKIDDIGNTAWIDHVVVGKQWGWGEKIFWMK